MTEPATAADRGGWLRRSVPGLALLAGYRREWLVRDLVAGVLLAAFIAPDALSYASMANLPPEAGLYACLFSGLVFWLFCSSRYTAVSCTSAISLMVGVSLADMAGGDVPRMLTLAAATALLVGLLAFVTWAVRAGVIVNFVSETVLVGFKCGVGLVLVATQLPHLLGLHRPSGSFFEKSATIVKHLGETNLAALAIGGCALVLLLAGKFWLKKVPMGLLVVAAGVVLGSRLDLAGRGVHLLGSVPQGLPALSVPLLSQADFNEILPLALACFLLAAVETAAIGRMFALKHGDRYEPNQEFLALSASNLAAAVGHGFPVSGGLSQSLVNEGGGARTPVSGLVSSALLVAIVLFMSDLLAALPQPVLAAIVLSAVTGLIKPAALARVWRYSRVEFVVAVVALVGVLESGILRGVLFGAALSIALLLRRASQPATTELGRVPGTSYFADRVRHPENTREPEVFVFRVESALLYFNVEFVRDEFFRLLAAAGGRPRLAVVHLGTVAGMDMAGAEMLVKLHESLRERGIVLRLAEARGRVRESLRRIGLDRLGSPIEANQTVHDVITRWRSEQA